MRTVSEGRGREDALGFALAATRLASLTTSTAEPVMIGCVSNPRQRDASTLRQDATIVPDGCEHDLRTWSQRATQIVGLGDDSIVPPSMPNWNDPPGSPLIVSRPMKPARSGTGRVPFATCSPGPVGRCAGAP